MTRKYNRNYHQNVDKSRWENINTEHLDIPNLTEIGAKRIATAFLQNEIKMPEVSLWHRESLSWSRWFPLAMAHDSYKITRIFEKYHLRAELLQVTK